MPPPKRPFTTSSLTSTLKSTIASQPLLSNSIDKLSSQASSLAHKTPFFGPQSNLHQHQDQQHQNDAQTSAAASNMMRGATGFQGNPQGVAANQSTANQQQSQQQRPPMATTPTVDMSHLTEEERLMIQSVMAKAEMADMGIPVDTSVPSSTNMPSNASQTLVQQQQHHQLQLQQQQQQQQQHQQQHQHQHQQQLQNRQQQQLSVQQNLQNQRFATNSSQNQPDFSQQQQQQQQMNDNAVNNEALYQNSQNLAQVNQSFNQQIQSFQQPQQQTYQQLPVNISQINSVENQSTGRDTNPTMLNSRNPLPLTGHQNQQPPALDQINSQFILSQQQQMTNRQVLNSQNVSQQFVNKQLEQQSRLQDVSGGNNYEQAMISQNQALQYSVTNGADTQQQVQNSMVAQQQAQYQQQSQMMIEQQGLIQKNQALQSDYSGQESILIGQMRNQVEDSAKQAFVQQPNTNNNIYTAGNTAVQNPNQFEQMLHSNTNSFDLSNFPDNSIRSNIVPQLQSDFHNTGSMNKCVDQLGFSSTSSNKINALKQQANNFNADKSQQQQAQAYNQEQSYRNVRGEIVFGNQQLQGSSDLNDHTLSDQEYNGGHARKFNRPVPTNRRNESLDMNEHRATHNMADDYYSRDQVDPRDRNLQAYDLANRSPQNFTRSMNAPHNRQLPQPNLQLDRSLQSSNEHVSVERVNSRSRDGKQKVSSRKPYRQDSPTYFSGSDQEEEEIAEKKKVANRKSPIELNKQNSDKNDEALRLISELKLTEQANEMMKQQQLLIKQSQELIKLQLEQQALSQGLKKSTNTQNVSATNNSEPSDPKNQDQDAESQIDSKEAVIDRDLEKENLNKRENQAKQKRQEIKNDQEDDTLSRNTRLELSKKSTSFCNDSDIEENVHSTSKPTSTRLNNLIEEDFKSSVGDRRNESNEKEKAASRKSNSSQGYTQNSYSQTCASPRYNRDLLQSPTDTTDSDIEPISNLRRNQRLTQAKSKNSVLRRREPTGLPPSPLPVAAAIQLHQMQQQQQSKQATATTRGTSMTRANFLRSRSVTSSPNHHLEHMSSGYMTDNQRNRSVSPDTLSEFGGQRRRKRLPEPPTNAVPITPSMVRKMIQAQKTGSVSGRLLNSVNAQSTFLTNTHATRSLSHDSQHSNDNQNSSRNYTFNDTINTTSGNFQQHTSTNTNNNLAQLNETSTGIHNDNTSGRLTSGASDLNKFLSSTYGNSILRNNISDVKDTPELDKLISKLDDYYGLDNKGNIRLPKASDVHLSDTYNPTLNAGPSVTSSTFSPTRIMGQNYSGYATKSSYLGNSNALMRCNSEGEYNLTSKLANRRPYRPSTFDEYRSFKDTSLTGSSYPERPSSYLSLSPNKQSRYRTPLSASQRLRDYQSSMGGDHWTSQPSSSKIESTYHYNRPMQFSSRLHNPTGSFDSEHLDYTGATTTSSDLRPYTSTLSDDFINNTRYQTRFSNTEMSIDSIRNKYRYPGVQDLSKYDRSEFNNSSPLRYQNSHMSELKRPYTSSRQNVGLTQQKSLDFDSRTRDFHANDYPEAMIDSTSYLGDSPRINSSPLGSFGQDYRHQSNYTRRDIPSRHNISSSSFAPLTKDDIINNGPKFNSIGYRFRTENQNKYVAQARTPIQCLQSRYPYPYKRILLSKNPKDRIGNGIGVRITGGRPLANLFDKVNRCIVTSGAFVTEVFQNSNVYFMGELNEGDQIIEWNGVNLCNRSDEEVQQILLSQFSDDEVEIVYLHLDKLKEAYSETDPDLYNNNNKNYLTQKVEQDQFDIFSEINKSGHQSSPSPPLTSRGRYINEASKGSIRRKLSLSSIAHMWSK